jgi:hypothetical protein
VSPTSVTEATIRASAAHADLPLTAERAASLTALLAAWLPAANALSERMQAAELQALTPAVTFASPPRRSPEDRQ